MSSFSVLKQDIWSGGLKLDQLKGYDEDFLLNTDQSLAKDYPDNVTYTVDKEPVTRSGPERSGRAGKTKASTTLTDALQNNDDNLVVSDRMGKLIRKNERHVELLPVTIKGHKDPYFIANLLAHVSCLDAKKSGARTLPGPGGVERIAGVKRLAIRAKDLPADRALFRIKEYPSVILVRDDLAKAFEAAELTGLEFVAIEAYSES